MSIVQQNPLISGSDPTRRREIAHGVLFDRILRIRACADLRREAEIQWRNHVEGESNLLQAAENAWALVYKFEPLAAQIYLEQAKLMAAKYEGRHPNRKIVHRDQRALIAGAESLLANEEDHEQSIRLSSLCLSYHI